MPYDVSGLSLAAANISYNGVPLGFTRDGVQIDIKTTTKRQEIDHFGTVESNDVVLRREASIKFKLVELTSSSFLTATGGSTSQTHQVNGNPVFTLPIGAGSLIHNTHGSLRIHPVDRLDNDTTNDFLFPNAAWSGTLTHNHRYDEVRTITVEFFAYRDPTTDILFLYGQ